jgi:putative GTP pyrophosphokinase
MTESYPWQDYTVTQYETDLKPLLERFTSKFKALLEELCSSKGLNMLSITSRVKEVGSLHDKIARKGYESPLSQVKDFCGLRIVTYYEDEVTKIADFLSSEFVVDSDHSGDKRSELGVGEFGYRTYNLVVCLGEQRSGLVEWSPFAGIPVEIQIRSSLQHVWAMSSHNLDYKNPKELPEVYRRKLFRLGALLELADEEFISIRDKAIELTESYKATIARGDLSSEINYFSLKEYILSKFDVMKLAERGNRLGLGYVAQNHSALEESLDRLLELTRMFSLRTLADFDEVLPQILANQDQWLQSFSEAFKATTEGRKKYGTGFSGIDFISALLTMALWRRLRSPDDLLHVFYEDAVKWIGQVIEPHQSRDQSH